MNAYDRQQEIKARREARKSIKRLKERVKTLSEQNDKYAPQEKNWSAFYRAIEYANGVTTFIPIHKTPDFRSRKTNGDYGLAKRYVGSDSVPKTFEELEYARLTPRWTRRLLANGWKETSKGWKYGRQPSVPIQQAIKEVNKELRAQKINFERTISDYLHHSGWTCLSHDQGLPEVWAINDWELEGICCRTRKQAYKIQLGLDMQARMKAELLAKQEASNDQ